MRRVLLHISDIHTGPPFRPRVAERLIQFAYDQRPDLVVVSGDLVQRADFPNQWRQARAFLHALPHPYLVVPGNHDVPLYLAPLRALAPLSIYKRMISRNLNPTFAAPGLFVVGANTAHGWTIDGGWLNRAQQRVVARCFQLAQPGDCRVIVLHHHLVAAAAYGHRRRVRNATQTAALLDQLGVELMLCGHVHVAFAGSTRAEWPTLTRGTIVCQSGTSTSRRGYGPERGLNSFNLIEINDQAIAIQTYRAGDSSPFVPVQEYSFPRWHAMT